LLLATICSTYITTIVGLFRDTRIFISFGSDGLPLPSALFHQLRVSRYQSCPAMHYARPQCMRRGWPGWIGCPSNRVSLPFTNATLLHVCDQEAHHPELTISCVVETSLANVARAYTTVAWARSDYKCPSISGYYQDAWDEPGTPTYRASTTQESGLYAN